MSQRAGNIPWQGQELWTEMETSLLTAARTLSIENGRSLSSLAQKIARRYDGVDEILSTLCGLSCPSCEDVCCRHATVWYDFRDVLFSYFHKQNLPAKQIDKTEDGICVHLQTDGCRLTRLERPFICTWYVCPSQKHLLESGDKSVRLQCAESLEEIQCIRKQLEDLFCSCV